MSTKSMQSQRQLVLVWYNYWSKNNSHDLLEPRSGGVWDDIFFLFLIRHPFVCEPTSAFCIITIYHNFTVWILCKKWFPTDKSGGGSLSKEWIVPKKSWSEWSCYDSSKLTSANLHYIQLYPVLRTFSIFCQKIRFFLISAKNILDCQGSRILKQNNITINKTENFLFRSTRL